ncbi:TonB-dependent siderophore receptor [Methylotenera sp.]|uniref:TonB-dependent siderophore receptor n=1 Tax=Methylotenera sp. TaxID=2051956 RepID=UPI002487CDD3|nr:TonB-dependent siderophore receptor [Methylotenera sp.]MDI1363233.1 TonB-dependent siderophore receptor [Methylotenera sp.]
MQYLLCDKVARQKIIFIAIIAALPQFAIAADANLESQASAEAVTDSAKNNAANKSETLPEVKVEAKAEQETATGPVHGYVAKRTASATKTDTPIIETPQSISVITSDFAKAIGANRVRDALGYSAGVTAAPYGAESRFEWFNVRGFYALTPGFYLDGLQLRNNNTWGVWRTENYATERIELMRGPSSVLYGQNSPGGMTNIVSKKPLEETSRELQVQVGNDARRQISGDFTGPVNDDGSVLYRIVGVLRDAELPIGGMKDDHAFIAPSLTWKISDATTLDLQASYLKDRAGVYSRALPREGSILPNPNGKISADTYFGDKDFDRLNQNQWMIGYKLEHKLNDRFAFRQSTRYGKMDMDYGALYPDAFVNANAGNPSDPANFRTLKRKNFTSIEQATAFNIDNQFEAKFDFGAFKHTFLTGLDYQRSSYGQYTIYDDSGTTIDAYTGATTGTIATSAPYANASTKLKQTGIYLQDQVKFDERWVATLGGRYDSAKINATDNLTSSKSQQSDSKLTGRAGLVYLAPNGFAPYVSYSESFVPNTTINPATGKPFDPESGNQYEVGLRYQPPQSKATYSAAVFQLTRDNVVNSDSNFIPKQNGEIRVRGLELEANLQPIDRLNVVAAWTWTPEANVIRNPANPSSVGKQANPVPLHQISLWTDYQWLSGIKAGLGLRYVGSTKGVDESAPKALSAYTLVDAMLGYTTGQWELALNARNLTDKEFISNCDASQCYYGDMRSVIGSLTYKF